MNSVRTASVLMGLGLMILVSGCSVSNLGDNFSQAVAKHDDPALVRDGAPSYLLLIDSLIEGDPEDADWLRNGAKLYALYSAVFVDNDPARARRLSERAFDYGQRALCAEDSDGCGLTEQPYGAFRSTLQEFDDDELPELFALTTSWMVWAQNHSEDWNVVAAIPKLELLLQRMIELDERYENGRVWMYLGILYSFRPPSLGGQPEQARQCFERAVVLTEGKDLSVKVAYARYYARMVYDRELHDRLLFEVRNTDPHNGELTLMNSLALREAEQLLASGENYF